MNIYRPLWSEGAFLAPQQFQQQAQWDTFNAQGVARFCVAHPWGVLRCAVDESALAVSRLTLEQVIVRFDDGTLIDSQVSDQLPPACDLAGLGDLQTATVLLALPMLRANGGNFQNSSAAERPQRYRQQWVNVPDLLGEQNTDMAVQRHALTLRYEHEENGEYMTCPLARLVRDGQGQWRLDSQFMPPLLTICASPLLREQLTQLALQLSAKRRRLMGMRRESNQRMADFAVADVSLFWLLNALNSHEPVLNYLLTHPGQHPERVYQELARLAGSLLTFSLEHDMEAIAQYDHARPQQVFESLFSLLGQLLEASLPSRVVSIELIKEGSFWKGALHDQRLREEADLYLSVRAGVPGHQLVAQFPQLCKAGSPDDVADIVNVALSGVPLVALSHVPAAIPLRLENQYFALSLDNDPARAMLTSGTCMFYVPGTLGDVQLELFAVLRS